MGFQNYTPQPGDRREAIKETALFLGDCVWSSKTSRFCLLGASAIALILATTKEEERLAPLSKVLIGNPPGSGSIRSFLEGVVDPHRQFREIQNIDQDRNPDSGSN